MQDSPFHKEREQRFRVVLKTQHKVETSFACHSTHHSKVHMRFVLFPYLSLKEPYHHTGVHLPWGIMTFE